MKRMGIVAALLLLLTLAGLPAGAQAKKILVIGAHPDDPECCMGGTICLLVEAGYEVVCVYTTGGQAGIAGRSASEAAAIRAKEAENAWRLMGTRGVIMSQVDGASVITPEKRAEMKALFEREKPDAVFTHWPIDGHMDHCICSILVTDTWRAMGAKIPFYYFESQGNRHSQLFVPTDYVDITKTQKRKYEACFCHESQRLERLTCEHQQQTDCFRGSECGYSAAEAFVRNPESEKLF